MVSCEYVQHCECVVSLIQEHNVTAWSHYTIVSYCL